MNDLSVAVSSADTAQTSADHGRAENLVHAIRPANAAALVAAGLISVILFPIISLQLLRSSAQGPDMAPEQTHVR